MGGREGGGGCDDLNWGSQTDQTGFLASLKILHGFFAKEHHIPRPEDEASDQTENDSAAGEREMVPQEEFHVLPISYDVQHEADTPKTPQSRGQDGFYDEEDQEEDESGEETDSDEQEEEDESAGGEDEGKREQKTFITELGVGDIKHKVPSAKQRVTMESPRKDAEKDSGELIWQQ